jgi:Sec-independent protein translocase protein TatA
MSLGPTELIILLVIILLLFGGTPTPEAGPLHRAGVQGVQAGRERGCQGRRHRQARRDLARARSPLGNPRPPTRRCR